MLRTNAPPIKRLPYNGQSFNLWRRPGLKSAFFSCKNAFADQRKALVPGGVSTFLSSRRAVSTFSSSHRAVSALLVILQIQLVRYFADKFCQCKKRNMTIAEKLYADCSKLVCLRDNGLCSFFVLRKTTNHVCAAENMVLFRIDFIRHYILCKFCDNICHKRRKNNFFRYFLKLCRYFIDKKPSRVLQLCTELINKYGIR